MQDKEIYEFAIIRLVPKVEREEFLNIGAIVLCKRQQYLEMKFTVDKKRLEAFAEDIDFELINEYLNAWKSVCKGGVVGGKIGALETHVRFRWLTANRSTIIQSSNVHPGICFDPERTLDSIFNKYVL